MPYRCSVVAYWGHTAEEAASAWPDHARYPVDTEAELVALWKALAADRSLRVVWLWGPAPSEAVRRLFMFHNGVDNGACGPDVSLGTINWRVDLRIPGADAAAVSATVDELYP